MFHHSRPAVTEALEVGWWSHTLEVVWVVMGVWGVTPRNFFENIGAKLCNLLHILSNKITFVRTQSLSNDITFSI